MPLRAYVVGCYSKGCPSEAVYKIASRWSDGITGELKTYSLCCESCLVERFRESLTKQASCRLAPGETLDVPGIYKLERDKRDRDMQRLTGLEESLRAGRDVSPAKP